MSEGRPGRRWTVTDAWGNPIYLTDERWEHICEGHSAMAHHEAELRETLRRGRRRQDETDEFKFRYRLRVPNLPDDATHIEAIVLFRSRQSTTAYPLQITTSSLLTPRSSDEHES